MNLHTAQWDSAGRQERRRMEMKKRWWLAVLTMALLLSSCAQSGTTVTKTPMRLSLKTLDGGWVSVDELEGFIRDTMQRAGVTGLSCAIINDSQVVYRQAFGVKDKSAGSPTDENTVFAAASFSKPLFGYLVMLLAEEGAIDLDKPLYQYLDKPLPEYPAYADLEGDDRYRQITARMALSHSIGFPNWRFLTEDGKLSLMFPPGTRFSYSGEGIVLLQMVVEEITGRNLEKLAEEKIFGPLGMSRSSYVWQEAYDDNFALPHDEYGRPRGLSRRTRPDAAGSMVTTAGDYAEFVTALLNAEGDRKVTVEEMLRPQIAISSITMFGPGSLRGADGNQRVDLSWGLAWGRFDSEHGRAFFHTGHDFGWQNYTATYPDKGIGIVLLSNSDNFESVAREIVGKVIGDRYSPFDWLGYIPFDPAKNRTPPPEPVAIEVAPTTLATYTGTYAWMQDGEERLILIRLEGKQLFITDSEEWAPLHAETETRFFVKGDDTRFLFITDDSGAVAGLSLVIQGLTLPVAPKIQ
jgi:CubicO group peptidase (beta-lactamase class C family)